MSYILDALNKSEQEKKSPQAPGLDTVHRPAPQRPGMAPWKVVVIALLVTVNLGGLAWLLLRSPEEVQPMVAAQATIPPPETTQSPVPPSTVKPTPTPVIAAPPPEPKLEVAEAPPVRISALPASVQRQIPDMKFSSHIFADDADLRMVAINDSVMRKGDRIAGDVVLKEITEDGVIVTFRHYTIAMSVLRDWSFD